MSRRAWGILIGVAAIVIIVAIVIAVMVANGAESSPDPTPSATPTETAVADPTQEPQPQPTLSPAPTPVEVSCETISTVEFQALMSSNAWISWETQDQEIGARPFANFPPETPEGALVCRWGESPDLATDNVIDLAWAWIEGDAAAGAQQILAAEGYVRIEAPEGVYLARPGAGESMDAEGYGDSYLFTSDDVRWAMTKADLAFVKAPDEAG